MSLASDVPPNHAMADILAKSPEELAVWIGSIRSVVQRIHRLVTGLNNGPDTDAERREPIFVELARVYRTIQPERRRIITLEPATRLGVTKAWRMLEKVTRLASVDNLVLDEFVESIDPLETEDILNLLSGVPRTRDLARMANNARASPDGTGLDVADQPNAINHEAIVESLRRSGKAKPAALVKYMADRNSASFDDVMHAVHEDAGLTEGAVRKLCSLTNKLLSDCDTSLHFATSTGRVFRISAAKKPR